MGGSHISGFCGFLKIIFIWGGCIVPQRLCGGQRIAFRSPWVKGKELWFDGRYLYPLSPISNCCDNPGS